MRLNIAVVGGGVAGLVAAWSLAPRGRVTLFEAADYLGGHTNTVDVDGVPVDTGFITYNERTYPQFISWLEELGVGSRVSDMSFGYSCKLTGVTYGGHNLSTFFARRRNLMNPDFLRFAVEVARFNRSARQALECQTDQGTLAAFASRFSSMFLRHYLLPLGCAIWSAPPARMLEFPARTYLQFFHNHGLLSVTDRPTWRTVAGGSQSYVRAFRSRFSGEIKLSAPVQRVRRTDGVELRIDGQWRGYDRVVLATHADQALRLLEDPDDDERSLLGAWSYQPNLAVLHDDESFLPRLERVRSSWNYVREEAEASHATLTYDMNRLQGLDPRRRYLVTLNPRRQPQREDGRWIYHHPQYDQAAVATQGRLSTLQGRRGCYFCGSYFGYGFHEDAVASARALRIA